jgi:hypothetical protein
MIHLAVENKENKIGFYKIDGRKINKFIDKVKRDIPDYKAVWSYDYIEKDDKSSIGVFINVKTILN